MHGMQENGPEFITCLCQKHFHSFSQILIPGLLSNFIFILWKIATTGLEENQRAGLVNQEFDFCEGSKVHLGYLDRKNKNKEKQRLWFKFEFEGRLVHCFAACKDSAMPLPSLPRS